MLQPLNRQTWTPAGCTPVQYSWDRRDRLSVIGAVILSPTRTRVGRCLHMQRKNVKTDDAVELLHRLRSKVRRPLIVVCDLWSVYRSAHKRVAKLSWRQIAFEPLPAYCPELNPAEALWSHDKYADLANFVPVDIDASLYDQASNHLLKLLFF